MPKQPDLEIVGDGPTGSTILTLDKNGVLFATGSRYLHNLVAITSELLAASLDKHIWICREGVWQVVSVQEIHSVAGTDAGAVTLDVKTTSGVTAPASGTTQLTGTINLKATANTLQNGTLIAAPTKMFPGDTLALDFTGTLTAVVGLCTVHIARVG